MRSWSPYASRIRGGCGNGWQGRAGASLPWAAFSPAWGLKGSGRRWAAAPRPAGGGRAGVGACGAGAPDDRERGLPKLLARLCRLLRKGLEATAPLWPPIRRGYALVHQAAHVLANHEEADGATVRVAYQALLAHMTVQQGQLGSLAAAVTHFCTVTASYWPGLFHCYDVPALPRTNNDLEQYIA